MKATTEKKFDELEKEWRGISERIKEVRLPGFPKTTFDLTNYPLLQRLIRYNPVLTAELNRRVPELTAHPFFVLPTAELETFSVASPQAGPDKHLAISHASYVDAGVSAHFDSGIAAFHSEIMGNLGAECPSVELSYQFPDDSHAISYTVKFKLFLYNLTDGQGADFRLETHEWGYSGTSRAQHVDLPEYYEEDTSRYLTIRVNASRVNGKKFVFKINQLDWSGSHVNWWFYWVKVTKTYVG